MITILSKQACSFKVSLLMLISAVLLGCGPELTERQQMWGAAYEPIETHEININTSMTNEQMSQLRGDGARPDMFVGDKPSHHVPPIFAVTMGVFNGPDAEQNALSRANLLTQRTGMKPFWVHEENMGQVVYFGEYREAEIARSAMRQLREKAAAGQIPNSTMFVVEVNQQDKYGEHDIRLQKDNGYYTLQIAVFAGDNREQSARMAERYVDKLRAMNKDAYYHHAPEMSTVSVGIFQYSDARLGSARDGVDGKNYYSKPILKLKNAFPYNLVNGKPIRVKNAINPKDSKIQESFLVHIPESKRNNQAALTNDEGKANEQLKSGRDLDTELWNRP